MPLYRRITVGEKGPRNPPRTGAGKGGRTPRFALTGTPGTGKSSAAALLPPALPWAEVGALARSLGAGVGRGRGVVVDLPRLRSTLRRSGSGLPTLLVGHLSHLLPVDGVIVLRCDPRELGRRLDVARRGTRADRSANIVAEATDLITLEALDLGPPVWEIDTTRRAASGVARQVQAVLRRPPPPRVGIVDWLANPRVTDYLLRRSP